MMVYPRQRHSFTDGALVQHLRATMLAFIEETLLGAPAAAWPLRAAPATAPSSTGSDRRARGTRPAS
jgi:hypothetical protein